MSTTWITLTKVCGVSVDRVEGLVDSWLAQQRASGDSHDTELKENVFLLGQSLEKSAHESPVVFFARYIDHWSTAAMLLFKDIVIPGIWHGTKVLEVENTSLLFLRVGDPRDWSKMVRSRIRQAKSKPGFLTYEFRMFLRLLYGCSGTHVDFLHKHNVPSAVLLFFVSMGSTILDEDWIAGFQKEMTLS